MHSVLAPAAIMHHDKSREIHEALLNVYCDTAQGYSTIQSSKRVEKLRLDSSRGLSNSEKLFVEGTNHTSQSIRHKYRMMFLNWKCYTTRGT